MACHPNGYRTVMWKHDICMISWPSQKSGTPLIPGTKLGRTWGVAGVGCLLQTHLSVECTYATSDYVQILPLMRQRKICVQKGDICSMSIGLLVCFACLFHCQNPRFLCQNPAVEVKQLMLNWSFGLVYDCLPHSPWTLPTDITPPATQGTSCSVALPACRQWALWYCCHRKWTTLAALPRQRRHTSNVHVIFPWFLLTKLRADWHVLISHRNLYNV